jgi:hypothetical protein
VLIVADDELVFFVNLCNLSPKKLNDSHIPRRKGSEGCGVGDWRIVPLHLLARGLAAFSALQQFFAVTAGTTRYGDSLYGNLNVIPICYVELGI